MERFIIVITQKRHYGTLALPYLAKETNEPFITLDEQITPLHIEQQPGFFTPEHKELVKILTNLNEHIIYKKFSKGKTLKLFIDQLSKEYLETHIRPYIEKYIWQALNIVTASNTPLYYKNPNYSQLYETDRIKASTEMAKAAFQFTKDETGLTYSLKILANNKETGLTNREIIEVTNQPCALLVNNHLYRFENIDSKKFRPFHSKPILRIPERSVETYMTSFVENCVRNHEVKTTGFEVITKDVNPTAILSLEQDLKQNPVFLLKFRYEKRTYLAGTQSKAFVYLEKEADQYTFFKFTRQPEMEQQMQQILIDCGLKNNDQAQYIPKNTNNTRSRHSLVEWLNAHNKQLTEEGIEVIQSFFKERYYTGPINLTFKYVEDQDWFDIQAVVEINGHLIPFHKFRKNILHRDQEFRLPNGQIFIIPAEWLTRYSEIMHFANEEDGKLQLDKMHFNLLDTPEGAAANNSQWSEKLEKLKQLNQAEIRQVPEGIKATLRPYQLEGFSWISLLHELQFGGILADDMGLGKTLQTLAMLADIYKTQPEEEKNTKENTTPQERQLTLFDTPVVKGFNTSALPASIIIMPTSLVHNWENEIKKFAPHLKCYIYTGTNRLRSKEIGKILRHYHVVLTTYGVVRNDVDFLSQYEFYYTILDESQNIKNPTSKLYKAITQLQARYNLVLTGTPIENSLTDLWAQMNYVNNGLLGSLNFFKNHYVAPITKNKDEEKEQKLQQLINPFILRRTKEMVAKELPPINEQVLYCDMTADQKKFYEREKSGIRNEILKSIEHDAMSNTSFMALQALTRLRQLANHPAMVDETYTGSSGKFDQIIQNLESIISENHKVLIFSSFVKDLELIEKELNTRHIKYSKLTGATTDRPAVIKNFTDDTNCRIFLISLKAGGVGLNLIEADYVFILNPWWNPAAEAQAINRAHRIGQTKNVFVYKFISSETIEEKIARLQERKQQLADTFINNNNPLNNLTKEEIKELFA
ncbi:DEAD/DEAH box helicase [Marinilabiliaceae bacterium JC017]|nr:DEAD/DEAH box helicase [Marinilabiliaceae bacterium JC017]